jgi:hypothetical protein
MGSKWLGLKNIFKEQKSVPDVGAVGEETRDGKDSFLKDGLYKNICQRLNLFVQNVKKSFLDGNVKKEDIVQTNVDSKHYIEKHQKKEKQEKRINANIADKNSILQDGNIKQKEENIAHKNVIGKINQKSIQEKEIHNILMEEQKNMPNLFTYPLDGEILEKKFMKEIIGYVENANKEVENYMHTILFQSGKLKTPVTKKILLHYVEDVIKENIVLNNRQEVQNGFFE